VSICLFDIFFKWDKVSGCARHAWCIKY